MPDHHIPSEAAPLVAGRRTVLRALTAVPVGLCLAGGLGTAAATAAPRALSTGMSGADVTELQIRVAGWAADTAAHAFLKISGFFDAPTEAAVRRFQRAHRLPTTGAVDPATHERLAGLAAADGSTAHFEWTQFTSPDGTGFTGGAADEATTREHVRRLMYKLEALRHKLNGREITVQDGFHSAAYQAGLRGPGAGTHRYGGTADITVPGLTTYAVYLVAQTCGFSGLGSYTQSWLHCDSRAEATQDTSTSWSWGSGMV